MRHLLGPALRTQSDKRLVTLVRAGYEVAFEEIVRRYGRPLTRYAASIVGGHSEDVTQDAFSSALLALRRDDYEIELRPWLFRIVRNTALNDLRDRPPTPEVLAEALAGGRSPAEELEHREELADLMRRLQALPERQRAAIVMRELEGLGHEEIAAALGLTGGAARQAIHRARQALRNGAGMLLPVPLLKLLLSEAGPNAAEAAVGAGGAAGASLALKATAATVLVAGAVGTGVALEDHSRSGKAKAAPVRELQSGASQEVVPSPALASSGEDASRSGNSGPGGGESEGGDDRGEHRDGEDGHDGGGDREDRSGPSENAGNRFSSADNSGPGSLHSERSDSGDSSGSRGGSGSGHDGSSSGTGSGSSGSSNSGSSHDSDSGSGSGSPGSSSDPADEEPEESVIDSSGPGSGGAGEDSIDSGSGSAGESSGSSSD